MAWSHLQGVGTDLAASGTTANPAVTMTSNLTSGSKLIAYVGAAVAGSTFPTVTGVSDGNGNNFTKVGSAGNYNDSGDGVAFDLEVWELDTPSGDVGTKPTITATISNMIATNGCGILVQEVSGLQTGASCINGSIAYVGTPSSTGTGNRAFPTYSSTASNEYLVQIYTDYGALYNPAEPTGYSGLDTNSSNANMQIRVAWKNSTDAAETGNWNVTQAGTGCQFGAVAFLLPSSTVQGSASLAVQPAFAATSGTVQGSASFALQPVFEASDAPFLTGVSSNNRYLVDQNGNPFLVNADTPWNLNGGLQTAGISTSSGLDLADVKTYLADRVSKGFNTILFSVGGSTDQAGNSPFTTFPTLNSAYWTNVDNILKACVAEGISVFLDPMDAYNFDTSSGTASQFTTYGQNLATRYADKTVYPGLVWFFGNDYGGSGVGDTTFNSTDIDALYTGFITGLKNESDGRLATWEFGGSETVSSDDATLSALTPIINGSYCYMTTYTGILRGYANNAGPMVLLEAAYENSLVNSGSMPHTPLDLRKTFLWPLTCGATGDFYGNDSLWEFNSGWQSQLDTTIVAQRKAINTVWQSIAWWTLAPDTGSAFVTSGRGTQQIDATTVVSQTPATNDATYGHYVTAAYNSAGTLGVVYNPSGATNTAVVLSDSVFSDPMFITRVDPTNGAATIVGVLGSSTTLSNPGNNAGGDPDWLYLVQPQTTVTGSASLTVQPVFAATGVETVLGSATSAWTPTFAANSSLGITGSASSAWTPTFAATGEAIGAVVSGTATTAWTPTFAATGDAGGAGQAAFPIGFAATGVQTFKGSAATAWPATFAVTGTTLTGSASLAIQPAFAASGGIAIDASATTGWTPTFAATGSIGSNQVSGTATFTLTPTFAAAGSTSSNTGQGAANLDLTPTFAATGRIGVTATANLALQPVFAAVAPITFVGTANFGLGFTFFAPVQAPVFVFTTPLVTDLPPVPEFNDKYSGPTKYTDPVAARLLRYYPPRVSTCTVFLMSDGTFCIDPLPDGWPNRSPMVADSGGNYPIAEVVQPWPPVPKILVQNQNIASSYVYADQAPFVDPLPTPYVIKVFYGGGQQHVVSGQDLELLQAAGFGGYISQLENT